MSDADRAEARAMLAQSVGKDGNVNLQTLKELQNRWANERKESYLQNSKNMGDMAAEIRSEFIHRIDRATKEVLGIIPESKWHYADNALGDTVRRLYEYTQPDHPQQYVCNVPKNFDVKQPLSKQGVTCHTR